MNARSTESPTSLESEYPGLCEDMLREVVGRMTRPKYPGAQPVLTTTLMLLPSYRMQERQAGTLAAIQREVQETNALLRELTDAVRALARA